MISIIGTTARSWAISTPTVRRPTGVVSSPMSSSILMVIAVLLIATTKPKSTASSGGQPKAWESTSMTPTLAPICNRVAMSAVRHVWIRSRMLSSMPTR